MSSVFSLCYQVFKDIDFSYSSICLQKAISLYQQANTLWEGELLSSSPFDYYPETVWFDDMELAAIELYKAFLEQNETQANGFLTE